MQFGSFGFGLAIGLVWFRLYFLQEVVLLSFVWVGFGTRVVANWLHFSHGWICFGFCGYWLVRFWLVFLSWCGVGAV